MQSVLVRKQEDKEMAKTLSERVKEFAKFFELAEGDAWMYYEYIKTLEDDAKRERVMGC